MDWAQLTLFLYITMRMSGFVLFNPLLGRNNSPAIVRAGLVLVLASAVFAALAARQWRCRPRCWNWWYGCCWNCCWGLP